MKSDESSAGTWGAYQWGATKQWLCLRDVPNSGGLCEMMKNPDGSLSLFATEAEAREAIKAVNNRTN